MEEVSKINELKDLLIKFENNDPEVLKLFDNCLKEVIEQKEKINYFQPQNINIKFLVKSDFPEDYISIISNYGWLEVMQEEQIKEFFKNLKENFDESFILKKEKKEVSSIFLKKIENLQSNYDKENIKKMLKEFSL